MAELVNETDDDKEEELVDDLNEGKKLPKGSKDIAMAFVNELANCMVENPIEVKKEVQKNNEKTNIENVRLLKCRRCKFTRESIRQLVKHTKKSTLANASTRNEINVYMQCNTKKTHDPNTPRNQSSENT